MWRAYSAVHPCLCMAACSTAAEFCQWICPNACIAPAWGLQAAWQRSASYPAVKPLSVPPAPPASLSVQSWATRPTPPAWQGSTRWMMQTGRHAAQQGQQRVPAPGPLWHGELVGRPCIVVPTGCPVGCSCRREYHTRVAVTPHSGFRAECLIWHPVLQRHEPYPLCWHHLVSPGYLLLLPIPTLLCLAPAGRRIHRSWWLT